MFYYEICIYVELLFAWLKSVRTPNRHQFKVGFFKKQQNVAQLYEMIRTNYITKKEINIKILSVDILKS